MKKVTKIQTLTPPEKLKRILKKEFFQLKYIETAKPHTGNGKETFFLGKLLILIEVVGTNRPRTRKGNEFWIKTTIVGLKCGSFLLGGREIDKKSIRY